MRVSTEASLLHSPRTDGRPWHSWRAAILPQLGRDDLAKRYRWDEPWDGPHNRELVRARPDVFGSSQADSGSDSVSHFVAVTGPQTIWPENYAAQFSDVQDGVSNTVCLVQLPTSEISWLDHATSLSRTVIRYSLVPAAR